MSIIHRWTTQDLPYTMFDIYCAVMTLVLIVFFVMHLKERRREKQFRDALLKCGLGAEEANKRFNKR